MRLIRWLAYLIGGLSAFLLILAMTRDADAHSWYDLVCCQDKDCGPALGAAYQSDGSLLLEVAPGQSVKVPAGYPVRPSRDGDYHVCIMLNQVRCVYVPANS